MGIKVKARGLWKIREPEDAGLQAQIFLSFCKKIICKALIPFIRVR